VKRSDACDKASIQTERTIDKIKDLQLQVAIDKTEVVAFYKKWGRPPNKASIQVGNVEIPIKSSFKYLGIIFDSKLTFREHFQYVDQKISKVNRALFRLLPNLRGPHESKRKLHQYITINCNVRSSTLERQANEIGRVIKTIG